MKTTSKLLAIFLAVFVVSKINAQTTMEEYNYVTKGYKVQLESGLDMKKGYELEDIDKQSTDVRTAELKILYRVKDGKKEIAAYMVVYQKQGGPKEYVCIPHPSSDKDVISKYWVQLYDGKNDSSQRLQLISYLLSRKMKW